MFSLYTRFSSESRVCSFQEEMSMHMKPLHYILFVVIMGPLVLFSSRMHWGPTGTMICVIVAIALGFVIIVSSKHVSRRVRRSLGSNRTEAANFLFGPTHPGIRKQEIRAAHEQVVANTRTGAWRAPTMLAPKQPQLPDPRRRPQQFSYPQYAAQAATQAAMQKTMALPQPTTGRSATATTRPPAPRKSAEPPSAQGRLTLGPDAAMPLEVATTSGLIVDTPHRAVAPVYVEEWIKLGLGFLIVDLYNQYTPFLAQLPAGFGFLAGSADVQESLTAEQQARYMAVTGTHEAIQIGKGIVTESLQIIFNFASFQDTTEAGTLLLALLKGFGDKVASTQGKPCAILVTDPRPLFPTDETKCVIGNSGVAQSLYDHFMNLLEMAQDEERERRMAVYLSTPTLAELEEEVLPVCRLWIVNPASEAEISLVEQYLDLTDDEVAALEDGETLLWDTWAEEIAPITVRFRRAAIALRATVSRRRTEAGGRLGEQAGLRTKDA
jgi:hypothetical protein